MTLSPFCYAELEELSVLTDTPTSKLAAKATEDWITSSEFSELLKRARERAQQQSAHSDRS